MGFEALVEAALQLLHQRYLERLGAQLWEFAEALNAWIYDLFDNPRADWRDTLERFLAAQASQGRLATPEGRDSLVAYLTQWAASVGLEPSDGDAPLSASVSDVSVAPGPTVARAHSPSQATATTMTGSTESFDELVSILNREVDLESIVLPAEPAPPIAFEHWRPRVAKVEVLKGIWEDYRELVDSGQYEPTLVETVSFSFASSLFPSSEPGVRITFDDGTILLVIGGGPTSGALGEQVPALLGVGAAAMGAKTLWQSVFAAAKHLGRETAEHVADSVVQEVTGLPVGPASLRRPKAARKAQPKKKAGTKARKKPRRRRAKKKPPRKIRRNPLHDVIEGKAQKTGTDGHVFRSYREAIKMAKSGRYDKIWLNRAYSTTTGTKTKPRRLPDVIGRRKTGEFDAIEVPSETDSRQNLLRRNLAAMGQLPTEKRGQVFIAPITRSTDE